MIPKSSSDFEELGSLLPEDFHSRRVIRHGCFNYLVCEKAPERKPGSAFFTPTFPAPAIPAPPQSSSRPRRVL